MKVNQWVEVGGRTFLFEFSSGYQGEVDYRVLERGAPGETRISHRVQAEDWTPGVWTLDKERYDLIVKGKVGLVTHYGRALEAPMLEAFKAYLQRELDETKAYMMQRSDLYGEINLGDPKWVAPTVKTGFFDLDLNTWVTVH